MTTETCDRTNSDFAKGTVRRCRDFTDYNWGFEHTPTNVTERLLPRGKQHEEWLDDYGEDTASVTVYGRAFGVGLVGGTKLARQWITSRQNTSDFAGSITNTELLESWNRAFIR